MNLQICSYDTFKLKEAQYKANTLFSERFTSLLFKERPDQRADDRLPQVRFYGGRAFQQALSKMQLF